MHGDSVTLIVRHGTTGVMAVTRGGETSERHHYIVDRDTQGVPFRLLYTNMETIVCGAPHD